MLCDPMFEVKMMMVFLKLTVRPCPSVIRPSSNTCSRHARSRAQQQSSVPSKLLVDDMPNSPRDNRTAVSQVQPGANAIGRDARRAALDLEKDVEDFGVRLFDLIEEHYRVRPTSHCLRQLPPLFVPNIPARFGDFDA